MDRRRREAQEMSYKAGLAGWATPADLPLQVHWWPLEGTAHLGQVRFAMKKGTGCKFAEKAGVDSLHSAREVAPRHCFIFTAHTIH